MEYDAVKKVLEKGSWISRSRSRSRSILFYKCPSIRRCRPPLWWLLYLPFAHRSCTNEFSGKNISRYFYVTLLRIEAPFAFTESNIGTNTSRPLLNLRHISVLFQTLENGKFPSFIACSIHRNERAIPSHAYTLKSIRIVQPFGILYRI